MPGRPITDQQHRYYMTLRKTHTQKTAAAMAGFSPSTGHRAEKDPRPPSERQRARRHGGGKPDPLADLWESEIVPLLTNAPGLKPITVLEEMQHRHPERDLMPARRTLERRIRLWRAEHGAEREVIFRQTHEPGRQGMSDFFNANKLGVTIAGQPLDHLIYHFALVYSGWEHAEVVLGGESFTALSTGLQNAFWQLGGVPKEHRTDSLSAAFANIEPDAQEDLRARYSTLCSDYGTQPTRNNRGIAHENGSIESRHGHFGTRLDQALQLRGSRDFATLEDYRTFVAHAVGRHNARHRDALRVEAPHLLPLPPRRSCDYDEATVYVTSSSGFSLPQGVLHGALSSDWPSPQGADIRRPDRTDASGAAYRDAATRASGQRWPGTPDACGQLSSRHPQPPPETRRAGRPRLSRSALPSLGVSSVLGRP